jgi:hypothetical protein
MDAGQHLHQRALAGPVLADQGHHLAAAHHEVDAAQRRHAGERLLDAVGTAAKNFVPEGSEGIFSGTPAIRILNPAEELIEFDPAGILRWSMASGADAYEVWAYRDSSMTQLQEFSAALTSRQYQFTKLLADQTYHIKISFRVNGSWQELPLFTLSTDTPVV